MGADDLKTRTQLLDNEIRIMRAECQRINHGVQSLKEKIKENNERIKVCGCFPRFLTWTVRSRLTKRCRISSQM